MLNDHEIQTGFTNLHERVIRIEEGLRYFIAHARRSETDPSLLKAVWGLNEYLEGREPRKPAADPILTVADFEKEEQRG